MPVNLICPNLSCRTLLQVPESARGKKVRCSCCGRDFVVPRQRQTGTIETEPPSAEPAGKK